MVLTAWPMTGLTVSLTFAQGGVRGGCGGIEQHDPGNVSGVLLGQGLVGDAVISRAWLGWPAVADEIQSDHQMGTRKRRSDPVEPAQRSQHAMDFQDGRPRSVTLHLDLHRPLRGRNKLGAADRDHRARGMAAEHHRIHRQRDDDHAYPQAGDAQQAVQPGPKAPLRPACLLAVWPHQGCALPCLTVQR